MFKRGIAQGIIAPQPQVYAISRDGCDGAMVDVSFVIAIMDSQLWYSASMDGSDIRCQNPRCQSVLRIVRTTSGVTYYNPVIDQNGRLDLRGYEDVPGDLWEVVCRKGHEVSAEQSLLLLSSLDELGLSRSGLGL